MAASGLKKSHVPWGGRSWGFLGRQRGGWTAWGTPNGQAGAARPELQLMMHCAVHLGPQNVSS